MPPYDSASEKQGRRALQLSGGDLSGLVGGPVAWVAYAIIVAVLLWPLVAKLRGPRGESPMSKSESRPPTDGPPTL